MAVTGLKLKIPVSGATDSFPEDRFDALLLIGDPGNRPFLPEAPWRAVAIPTLVVTGTNDHGQKLTGDNKPMQMEFADGTVFSDTPNHYLFIDDMDHYMGGLICRSDVPGEPDYDAVVIARGVSTVFLDAYMKDDEEARVFLGSDGLGAFTDKRATLDVR